MEYTWAEKQIIVSLAGVAAERRALQKSESGWEPNFTPVQLICFHESSHATVARSFDWHAHELNIDPPPGLTVERGRAILAYCAFSKPQHPAGNLIEPRESDRRTVAKYALVMVGDWKGAVRCIHLLRAATRAAVETNWKCIWDLAWELHWRRRLNHEQIEKILAHL
jgi:hypothetical protein